MQLKTVVTPDCISFLPYQNDQLLFDSIKSIPSSKSSYNDLIPLIESGKLNFEEIDEQFLLKSFGEAEAKEGNLYLIKEFLYKSSSPKSKHLLEKFIMPSLEEGTVESISSIFQNDLKVEEYTLVDVFRSFVLPRVKKGDSTVLDWFVNDYLLNSITDPSVKEVFESFVLPSAKKGNYKLFEEFLAKDHLNVSTKEIVEKFALLEKKTLRLLGDSTDSNMMVSNFIQNYTDLLENKENALFNFVQSYVTLLDNNSLPTRPIELLVSKLENANMSKIEKLEILACVKNFNIPVTWTGDLVIYSRSSYTKNHGSNEIIGDFNSAPFVNGKTYYFDPHKPACAGNLDWVYKMCPDAGSILELVVKVEDIVSTNTKSEKSVELKIKEFTYLTSLKETFIKEEGSRTPIVMISNKTEFLGNSFLIRQPYNATTLVNYITTKKADSLIENPGVKVVSVSSC